MSTFGSMITDVIKDFGVQIDKVLTTHISTLYDLAYPIWAIGMSVYFLFIIYSMIYQNRDVDMQEFIKHMTVIALITAFLGTSGKGGAYSTYVIPFVTESGDTISAKIMGGKSASSLVELLFKSNNELINNLWVNATKKGWMDDKIGAVFMASIQTVLLLLGGAILALYAFVYIIITKLMIAILLSLGGIFIMFSAIPSTRPMFNAWVGACLNYIFLNVSFSIAFSLILTVIGSYTKYEHGWDGKIINLMSTIAIFFLYLAGILLLQQISVMTSSLTGGVGINGLTSAVNSAFTNRGTQKVASSMARGSVNTMQGIGKFTGNAINKLRGEKSVKG